jgi:hypothetical protein
VSIELTPSVAYCEISDQFTFVVAEVVTRWQNLSVGKIANLLSAYSWPVDLAPTASLVLSAENQH